LNTTVGAADEPRALAELASRWRAQGATALPGPVVDGLLAALHDAVHINHAGRDGYANTLRRTMPPGWPLAEQVAPALAALEQLSQEALTALLDAGELGSGRLQAVLSAFAAAREVLSARAPDDPHVTVEQALAARDRQLTIATHELRTPISSITLNLQLLERTARNKESLPSAAVLKLLEIPSRQLRRLAHMVDRLLDAAQVESGRLVLHREPVDLCELVHDVGRRMVELAKTHGCELGFEDCHSVHGEWDRLRLEQVFDNLLTNAIKYGGDRVRVTVQGGAQARVEVRDRGPGIPPEDRERIFEPYERLNSAAGEDGAGLGLYIVREIVRAHGGHIEVQGGPGAGTAFIVTLPI
jgi:signal transduction histidine kinase